MQYIGETIPCARCKTPVYSEPPNGMLVVQTPFKQTLIPLCESCALFLREFIHKERMRLEQEQSEFSVQPPDANSAGAEDVRNDKSSTDEAVQGGGSVGVI
jgi:hypothetical protein